MEAQPTDFENAALAAFVVLLSRAILFFGLTFYVPISKVRPFEARCSITEGAQVDENMARAHVRDAAREGRFWFRKDVFASSNGDSAATSPAGPTPTYQLSDAVPCVDGSCAELLPLPPPAIGTEATNAVTNDSLGMPGVAALEEARLGRRKETRLRNCFPAVPPPARGVPGPVDKEYEEMSLREVFCGKVRRHFKHTARQ